jgi:hypothetical protein
VNTREAKQASLDITVIVINIVLWSLNFSEECVDVDRG